MNLFIQSLGFDNTPSDLFTSILQLPKYIDAVKGDKLQLFYNGMIVSPYTYYVQINCSIGRAYPRYFETTPTATGETVFHIKLMDSSYTVIAEASTIIRVKEAISQPATTHNFWAIGDSLTNGVTKWDYEMARRLTGTAGTPTGHEFGNITHRQIGVSGKHWDWYVNDEESPFVYSGVLDFTQYRVDNSLDVPQSIYILLTWNNMGLYRNQSQWNTWDDDVYTFINGIKADFPDCDIKILSPQLPSLNGSLGIDYPALGQYYSDYFLQLINAKKQAQIYERISLETGFENVEHIETCIQFDNLYNMGLTTKDVNTRNTAQEDFGTTGEGVHPSLEGYLQIGDAAYRNFINNYCQ